MHLSATSRGVDRMAISRGISKTRRKALAKWFPAIGAAAEDARTAAKLETWEILTDVEQVSNLFASFEDARQGKIVSMDQAFGDL